MDQAANPRHSLVLHFRPLHQQIHLGPRHGLARANSPSFTYLILDPRFPHIHMLQGSLVDVPGRNVCWRNLGLEDTIPQTGAFNRAHRSSPVRTLSLDPVACKSGPRKQASLGLRKRNMFLTCLLTEDHQNQRWLFVHLLIWGSIYAMLVALDHGDSRNQTRRQRRHLKHKASLCIKPHDASIHILDFMHH